MKVPSWFLPGRERRDHMEGLLAWNSPGFDQAGRLRFWDPVTKQKNRFVPWKFHGIPLVLTRNFPGYDQEITRKIDSSRPGIFQEFSWSKPGWVGSECRSIPKNQFGWFSPGLFLVGIYFSVLQSDPTGFDLVNSWREASFAHHEPVK